MNDERYESWIQGALGILIVLLGLGWYFIPAKFFIYWFIFWMLEYYGFNINTRTAQKIDRMLKILDKEK